MPVRKKGLNKEKGLETLIPKKMFGSIPNHTLMNTEEKNSTDIFLQLSEIIPNSEQPRKKIDEDTLMELSESIKQFGILQPLLVQKKGKYYEIIAGERRWRAAKLAGIKRIPVIIKKFSPQEVVEISLIENIQRENLNAIEEARAFKRLIEEFHLKQDEVAKRVSKSRSAVTNSMRLLKLDERAQKMLVDAMISIGHARSILSLEDSEMQYMVAKKIFDDKLSVRETEKLVKRILKSTQVIKRTMDIQEEDIYKTSEEKLKKILKTNVSIQRYNNHKGKIEIKYSSQDEFKRIIELLEKYK
ncbi:MAG: ParB/RepB/Spo0J family partition protein [Lachnospiraceae bacterium]|nr:ParB/RepB/Spo0J family partition protein [Lachnospiraceae bacterium]